MAKSNFGLAAEKFKAARSAGSPVVLDLHSAHESLAMGLDEITGLLERILVALESQQQPQAAATVQTGKPGWFKGILGRRVG